MRLIVTVFSFFKDFILLLTYHYMFISADLMLLLLFFITLVIEN
jgi:hypothetical protein